MGCLHLVYKIIRICFTVSYLCFWGGIYTLLKPIATIKNSKLKNDARKLNANAAKNLNCDAESVFVRLPKNNICLHAIEAGPRSGKLVILLHGFPDCWHCWKDIIPALAKKGFFVVAPDMRGYNLSDKPNGVHNYQMGILVSDVVDLLAFYHKKKAIVVAHDWGGVVAWALAERHPELLEKLIILNAPHGRVYTKLARKDSRQLLAAWYIFFFQIPILPANLIAYNPRWGVKIFFTTRRKHLTPEDTEILASAYSQTGSLNAMLNYYKAFVRSMIFGSKRRIATGESSAGDRRVKKEEERGKRGEEERGKREEREQITVPTLVLWGKDDVALVPEQAQVSEYVKNVQIQYIPNCSHWVPYEVPEILEREILKFIS